MDASPESKRAKLDKSEEEYHSETGNRGNESNILQIKSPTPDSRLHTPVKAQTPKKLIFDGNESIAQQSYSSSSLQAPNLKPPSSSSRGRDVQRYSQSPPRSPGRSPGRASTRKLELIQLSPVKNSRAELQRIYDANQSQANTERLCIDKLILEDFKSYAGRQTIGSFHSNFSAVIGPNGSGKSNVIDSMLFVFGFRASKMRQDRLSDLIHKSEKYPNLQSCSVEVHFKYVIDELDGTAKENKDKAHLVITRKAFKSNTSKYYINGRESNYTEVTQLLRKEGIDLDHKRFLILQGEVENIAQMKPKAEKESDDGLLEYLEDIIGTTKYKPLIEQHLTKVEELNEICLEKQNRFDIVDREKNALESGKDKALEFIKKEKDFAVLQNKLNQYHILNANRKLTKTLGKIDNLTEELEMEQSKFAKTTVEIQALKEEENVLINIQNQHDDKKKSLLARKRKLKDANIAAEEKLKNMRSKQDKLERDFKETQNSVSSSESTIRNLEGKQELLKKELEALNEGLSSEQVKLDKIKLELKGKTLDISDEIAKHEKDLEPWNAQLQEKQLQIQLVESEIGLLNESRMEVKQDIAALQIELETRTKDNKLNQQRLEDLEREQKNLKTEIKIGNKELLEAKDKLKDMRVILNNHRQHAIEARNALSNTENKNKVLAGLERLQKVGQITGFHGRLGDLAVIDEEYDIAISTACPRLDDIVVETVECGQKCIEYLRKHRLGYARFILLDKLRTFNLQKILTPNNASRLFDLIEVKNQKFLSAFYSVLRDTLVVKNLKEANQVAYGKKRYRVVTLDGKLIDLSGTMSGGGSRVSRGLMALKKNGAYEPKNLSEEEVTQIENALVEKERNYEAAADAVHEMEEELRRITEKEPLLEVEKTRLLLEMEAWKSERINKERNLQEKEHKLKQLLNDKRQIAELEAKETTLKDEYKSLLQQSTKKNKVISILRQKIMDIGGAKLKDQGTKVNKIREQIEEVTATQRSERAQIKKAHSELKKFHKRRQHLEKELTNCKSELESTEADDKQAKKELEEIEESLNELDKSSQEFSLKLSNLKDQINTLEGSNGSFKSFELEIKNKIEKLNAVINQIKRDIQGYEQVVSTLTIRDIDNVLKRLDMEAPLPNNEEGEVGTALVAGENSSPSPSKVAYSMTKEEPDIDIDIDAHPLPNFSEEELLNLDVESVENEIIVLKDYLENSSANVDILEEYARQLTEFKRRKSNLNQAVAEREEIKVELEDLKRKRFDEFMSGFSIISMTLKEMYQMITMGGNAELELIDSLDPFSEGVTFSVMPPKKSWRNISNLSGGEKTLSSLALVFALHKYKPTPLYVMDEIDAALDFRNVSIVANYIKERTKNAQFIVISLRNNMFELAQQLVGIYKRDNMTKSAALQNQDLLKDAAVTTSN